MKRALDQAQGLGWDSRGQGFRGSSGQGWEGWKWGWSDSTGTGYYPAYYVCSPQGDWGDKAGWDSELGLGVAAELQVVLMSSLGCGGPREIKVQTVAPPSFEGWGKWGLG